MKQMYFPKINNGMGETYMNFQKVTESKSNKTFPKDKCK